MPTVTLNFSADDFATLTAFVTRQGRFPDVAAYLQAGGNVSAAREGLKALSIGKATATELDELAAKVAAREAINGGGK